MRKEIAPAGCRKYTVSAGDKLWTIAKEQLGNYFRYTDIVRINHLKFASLQPGQVLFIPAK